MVKAQKNKNDKNNNIRGVIISTLLVNKRPIIKTHNKQNYINKQRDTN